MCTVSICRYSTAPAVPAVHRAVALHETLHSATHEGMELGGSVRNFHASSPTTSPLSNSERDPYSDSGVVSRSDEPDLSTGH
jgi:hypothetical protein